MTTLDPRIEAAFFAAEPGPEPEAAEPEAEVYGPQFPDLDDLYRARDAAEYGVPERTPDLDRAVLERQQTEVAYLAGSSRALMRALEAEPEPEAEWEPEWDCADANAYQARVEAGLEL